MYIQHRQNRVINIIEFLSSFTTTLTSRISLFWDEVMDTLNSLFTNFVNCSNSSFFSLSRMNARRRSKADNYLFFNTSVNNKIDGQPNCYLTTFHFLWHLLANKFQLFKQTVKQGGAFARTSKLIHTVSK